MDNKAIRMIEANSKWMTSLASTIAAVGAVVAAVLSAQPSVAVIPQYQLDMITEASQAANRALTMATSNQARLGINTRRANCMIRNLDRLADTTGTKPSPCALDIPE